MLKQLVMPSVLTSVCVEIVRDAFFLKLNETERKMADFSGISAAAVYYRGCNGMSKYYVECVSWKDMQFLMRLGEFISSLFLNQIA